MVESPRLPERFEGLSLLGRGGMGAVYRARDRVLDREVAVKLLLSASDDALALFRREARILAALEHERVVRIHDFGDDGGQLYLVMELVRGRSLAARLAAGRPTLPETARVMLDVLEGLEAVHRKGIVHRDVKPANIFLDESGRAKVADFGVSRRRAGPADSLTPESRDLVGTLCYLAPEQARGEGAGPPADIYAAAVTMHEMLTGRRLDAGLEVPVLLARRAAAWMPDPPSRVNPAVPASLDAIVMSALAGEPAARPDAAAFAQRLREWLQAAARPVPGPAAPAGGDPPGNPYKELVSYDARDAARFFGRDAEAAELAQLVEDPRVRLVMLFGPCGAGKSSLVRAGLIARLPGARYDTLELSAGADPARALEEALVARAQQRGLKLPSGHEFTAGEVALEPRLLADLLILLERSIGRSLVVVVDQLEELFTLNPAGTDRVARFFRRVEDIVEAQAVRVKLLLSFRTEFRGELFALETRLARFLQSYPLAPMGLHQLRDAIEGPSREPAFDFSYEPGFAHELAREIQRASHEKGESALPLMQIVCHQLYARARAGGGKPIGPELLQQELGGTRGALVRHVEGRLAAFGSERQAGIARQMLRALTVKGEGGERFARALAESDLLAFPDREAARLTLERLIGDHLVARTEANGRREVRLVSEVVCAIVERFAQEPDEIERASRTLARAFAHWKEQGESEEHLLAGAALATVERHAPALSGVSPGERDFLARSVSMRRRRTGALAAAGGLVLAVVSVLLWAALLREGSVRLESTPSGATVLFGERTLGATPLTWSERPGTYALHLKREGCEPVDALVRISPGGHALYHPVLAYESGLLSVGSEPMGATCRVAGSRGLAGTWRTPFTTEVPSGAYTLELGMPGYVPQKVTGVQVAKNRELVTSFSRLAPDAGQLRVATGFKDIALAVRSANGELVWESTLPMKRPHDLPTGTYLLECAGEEHWSDHRAVAITRGTTTAVEAWCPRVHQLASFTTGRAIQGSPFALDVDGDGRPEIVAASRDAGLSAFRFPDGKALWNLPGDHRDPVPANLDGDGRIHVLTMSQKSGVLSAVDPRTGKLRWTANVSKTQAVPIAGDLDGDGDDDIVVEPDDDTVRALDGRTGRLVWATPPIAEGDGVFGHPGSNGILVDANGDGWLDVVTNRLRADLRALSGRDGGLLWRYAVAEHPSGTPVAVRVGVDRRLAVLFACEGGLAVLDAATGRPTRRIPLGRDEGLLPGFSADLDEDGSPDVVVVDEKTNRPSAVSVATGRRIWTNRAHGIFGFGALPADLDGDGVPDLVGHAMNESLAILSGRTGHRLLHYKGTRQAAHGAPLLADFDGDGVLDIAQGSGTSWLREYSKAGIDVVSGRRTRLAAVFPLQDQERYPGIGDVDGDGRADFVMIARDRGVRAISGRTLRTSWSLAGRYDDDRPVSLLDVNADGRPELLLRKLGELQALDTASRKPLWSWPRNDEEVPIWQQKSVSDVNVEVGDLDGDRRPDLVALTFRDRTTTAHALSGRTGEHLWEGPASAGGEAYHTGRTGDLDADGTTDIAFGHFKDGAVAYSGRTGERLWAYSSPGCADCELAIGDLDGDGRADAVIAGSDGKVHALDGRTGKPRWVVPMAASLDDAGVELGALDAVPGLDAVVVDRDGTATALSGKDGKPIWSRAIPDARFPGQLQLVDHDGDGVPDVMFGGRDGQRRVLSGRDGHTIFEEPLGVAPVLPSHVVTLERGGPPMLVDIRFDDLVTVEPLAWRTAGQRPAPVHASSLRVLAPRAR